MNEEKTLLEIRAEISLQEEREVIIDLSYLNYWWHREKSKIFRYVRRRGVSIYSRHYQEGKLKGHLFFAFVVVEDFKLSIEKKITNCLFELSQGKSKILVIEGGRGSGKTTTAFFLIEELHKRGFHKKICIVKEGERPKGLPKWIKHFEKTRDIPKGYIAIFDESAIFASSRDFATSDNKHLSKRLTTLRHRDISIIFITQHINMVDINIRRLADMLLYKMGASLNDSESGILESHYKKEILMIKKELSPRQKKQCLLRIRGKEHCYSTFEHGCATFWTEKLSKLFSDYDVEDKKKEYNIIGNTNKEVEMLI